MPRVDWTNPVSRHDGGGNLHSVETFTGVRVVVLEGDGSSSDPIREVTHYFDENGDRIAVRDATEGL